MVSIKIIYTGRGIYSKPQHVVVTHNTLKEAKMEAIRVCRKNKWEPQYCYSIVEGLTYT